jgi:methionyl aminopeptidase
MTFTIEPMINLGGWRCRVLDDGWTAVTADGSLSAQFEHTVLVADDGVEVLTLGANERPPALTGTDAGARQLATSRAG